MFLMCILFSLTDLLRRFLQLAASVIPDRQFLIIHASTYIFIH